MAWWLWLVAGLVLMLAELLTPGTFFLLFFGIGAALTGGAVALGLLASLTGEILLFLVLSLGLLASLRRRLLESSAPGAAAIDSLCGELALPRAAIAPGAVGQAELRGTVWSARNTAARELAPGERCRVERVDGLTIYLRPEE